MSVEKKKAVEGFYVDANKVKRDMRELNDLTSVDWINAASTRATISPDPVVEITPHFENGQVEEDLLSYCVKYDGRVLVDNIPKTHADRIALKIRVTRLTFVEAQAQVEHYEREYAADLSVWRKDSGEAFERARIAESNKSVLERHWAARMESFRDKGWIKS